MSGTKNRARLLHLIDLFHKETDDEHSLSLNEIKDRLEVILNDTVSVRSITDDIKFLRERRNVIEKTVAHGEKRYSMPRVEFEIHELRILVDAIASARSITERESERLIRKIKSLTSRHMGTKLENQIYLHERIKASNERLKYYITDIHQAITEQTKITFQYAKYTPTLHREFVHGGQIYVVSPYGLIWYNDYYYVVGEHEQESKVKSFRLDRMENVALAREWFRRPDFSVADYINSTFNMYSESETPEYIEVEFDNQLINVVTDRFGPQVRVIPVGDQAFRVRVRVDISDGLVRWLLNWGGDTRVISPQRLVDRMKGEAERMLARYTE